MVVQEENEPGCVSGVSSKKEKDMTESDAEDRNGKMCPEQGHGIVPWCHPWRPTAHPPRSEQDLNSQREVSQLPRASGSLPITRTTKIAELEERSIFPMADFLFSVEGVHPVSIIRPFFFFF